MATPLEQIEFVYQRLRSDPGIWERLCTAAEEGRPGCIRKIIEISANAGIIAMVPDESPEAASMFQINSGHHESVSLMKISPEENAYFQALVWALEGRIIKIE